MLTWRIHEGLADSRADELIRTIESNGDAVQRISGHWRALPAPTAPSPRERGGLALTTLQDAVKLLTGGWRAPRLLYFSEQRFNVSFWMPRLAPSIPVLNRGCLFIPVGALGSTAVPLGAFVTAESGQLFIRPDSGIKLFPGLVLDRREEPLETWDDVARAFERQAGTQRPETLACVSLGRLLRHVEWRFWIVNRKVVASSPYSWDRAPLGWMAPPPQALHIAEAMSQNPWQPDIAYVVDVVQLEDGNDFFLNELNAASTSGLYAVPFEPLVAALRCAVIAEAEGEISLED